MSSRPRAPAHPLHKAWEQFQATAQDMALLAHPAYAEGLEAFRGELIAACGEDPTLSRPLDRQVRSAEDFTERSIVEYLGWCLNARHAALYQAQGHEPFRCLASFGRPAGFLRADGVLATWLWEHGPLVRRELRLLDCSTEQAECLLRELDELDAALVVPISFQEGIWGLIVVGPPVRGAYEGEETLTLSLYGWEILRCLDRRRHGWPTRTASRAEEETQRFNQWLQLWESLRPPEPFRLLVVDEEPKVVSGLTTLGATWGLETIGATTEPEALKLLARHRPHLLMVDLSLYRRMPVRLLEARWILAPESFVLGTTTGHSDRPDSEALQRGVQHILRKPFTAIHGGIPLLEAAVQLAVRVK